MKSLTMMTPEEYIKSIAPQWLSAMRTNGPFSRAFKKGQNPNSQNGEYPVASIEICGWRHGRNYWKLTNTIGAINQTILENTDD